MDVGIEAMTFQPGSLVLDLAKVYAPGKDEDPKKFTKGLGLEKISLPDTDEDIVTLGATAAQELMDNEGLNPRDIGRIDVATESSFDRSKPASTYIAGCLEQYFDEDFDHVNKGERKFACISGTQAVNDSLNWIQAGVNNGKKAIVIATDLAFYERGDPGEATQGAGAVAMLVDKDPSLTKIQRIHGYSSRDETDFLKPNQQYPAVDGPKSVNVYLNRMADAIDDFESKGGEITNYALAPFHTPFPQMVSKAAPYGYRRIARKTGLQDELESHIGVQPQRNDFESQDEFEKSMSNWMDELSDTEMYQDWFNQVVSQTLKLSSRVGNLYTGSVHLARLSGLLEAHKNGRDITGDQIFVASYGSGAQAEVHAEVVQPGWQDKVQNLGIESKLENRQPIEDFETYVEIHQSHEHSTAVRQDPISTSLSNYSYTRKGDMGQRMYEIITGD